LGFKPDVPDDVSGGVMRLRDIGPPKGRGTHMTYRGPGG
jgi:hypothetical protein